MASTTKTPNYNLSQFADDDIPQWRTDYNGDMTKIDTAIKAASDTAGSKVSKDNIKVTQHLKKSTSGDDVTLDASDNTVLFGNIENGNPIPLQIDTDNIKDKAVTAAKIDFETFVYSTNEQVVGKWVDGKTVYRKVFTTSDSFVANERKNVVFENNSNIGDIIKWGGNMTYGDGGVMSVPYAETTGYAFLYVQSVSRDLILAVQHGFTENKNIKVWVEYTKR